MRRKHPTLETACTEPEILEAAARLVWWEDHKKDDCPADNIPTGADLFERVAEAPQDVLNEAGRALAVMFGGEDWRWVAYRVMPGAMVVYRADDTAIMEPTVTAECDLDLPVPARFEDAAERYGIARGIVVRARRAESGPLSPGEAVFTAGAGDAFEPFARYMMDLTVVNAAWKDMADGTLGIEHPAVTLVRDWQESRPVALDSRETAILPGSMLGAVAYIDGQDPQLPLTLTGGEIGDVGPPSGQRPLFDFEPPTTSLVPVLPLQMYRDAGGLDRDGGRGAPIAKRIWWSAIAHTPLEYRKPDGSVPLKTTLRDLNDWLYPGQRWRSDNFDRVRRGLWGADSIRIDWERREWRIVEVVALPKKGITRLDDPLPIRVAMPPGSDRGALIVMSMLHQCGTVSGPVFDAAIRLAYLWDAAKGRNGSRRIYATRPKVLRDERGRLTDGTGRLLLGPDPSLPPAERRKVPRDKPATNWRDSRAVVIGTERNPAADRVPELDRRDLVRLFHGDPVPEAPSTLADAVRKCRTMLRKHFERPGFVVVEECRQGRDLKAIRILQRRADE